MAHNVLFASTLIIIMNRSFLIDLTAFIITLVNENILCDGEESKFYGISYDTKDNNNEGDNKSIEKQIMVFVHPIDKPLLIGCVNLLQTLTLKNNRFKSLYIYYT